MIILALIRQTSAQIQTSLLVGWQSSDIFGPTPPKKVPQLGSTSGCSLFVWQHWASLNPSRKLAFKKRETPIAETVSCRVNFVTTRVGSVRSNALEVPTLLVTLYFFFSGTYTNVFVRRLTSEVISSLFYRSFHRQYFLLVTFDYNQSFSFSSLQKVNVPSGQRCNLRI